MKFSRTQPEFTPITLTFESQQEIDFLADALYELELDEIYNRAEYINIIRDLRIELHDFHSRTLKDNQV